MTADELVTYTCALAVRVLDGGWLCVSLFSVWQFGKLQHASRGHLVQLSEVCQEEEVGRLGPFELRGISGSLLPSWWLWVILLILCHGHTIVCLQQHGCIQLLNHTVSCVCIVRLLQVLQQGL